MPETVDERLARRVRAARQAARMSQAELGEKMGLRQNQLSRLERGAQVWTARDLVEAALALRVSPEFLLFDEEVTSGIRASLGRLAKTIADAAGELQDALNRKEG